MRNKSNFFGFFLNDEDAELLHHQIEISGLKKSDYLTRVVLNRKLMQLPSIDGQRLKVVYDELRRQGNNLNQIAKHLNAGGRALSDDIVGLLKVYQEVIEVCQPQKP